VKRRDKKKGEKNEKRGEEYSGRSLHFLSVKLKDKRGRVLGQLKRKKRKC